MQNDNTKIFEDLMNSDKDIRTRAESKINEIKLSSIDNTIKIFQDGMSSDKPLVAQLATLLLKKTYLDDQEKLKVITPQQIETIKSILKNSISFEKEWKTLLRIGEALAKLYSLCDLKSTFSDIMNWFVDSNSITRQFAIFIIEVLCDLKVLSDNVVKESINDFSAIFQKGLTDVDVKVRVSSLKSITQFLSNLSNKETILKFSPLTSNIIDTLILALKNDEEKGKNALEALNTLTESHPKFWKENLEYFVSVIYEISRESSFKHTIRESALELIYTLANKTPAFLRKSPNFTKLFIPLFFQLLLELDNINNLNAWNSQTEEDELDKEEMYYSMREGIKRITSDLGGNFMLQATIEYIKTMLNSSNWVEVHAAFTAIGYMSEGCKDQYKSNITDLLNYISVGLVHDHIRVKYSALTALSFLLEDLAPLIQKKYHTNILPAICKLMINNELSNIRLITQACGSLVTFLRGIVSKDGDDESDIIKPYASELLQLLSNLFDLSLKINYSPLQEETLTNLSLLSTLLDKDFAPYYPSIMPGLKQIFYNLNPTTPQQQTLKSHAIETMSYLCSSVSENAEAFFNDFKELTQAFGNTLVSLKEEDPQVIAILNAFTHISTSMREHFYPYLETLIPILENYINADIDFKLEDADVKEYVPEENEKTEKLSLLINVAGIDNKKLSMNTHALQNKIMAMTVLHEISLNMGKSFGPFIPRYLEITKKYLQFPYSRKIRKLSAKSLYSSILGCKDDEERKNVMNTIGNEILSVYAYVLKGKMLREIKSFLKILTNTFDEIENINIFDEKIITTLYQLMHDTVIFIEDHKKKVKDSVKAEEGYDENDADILENDIGILNETNRRVMELSGILFKLFKENLTEIINKYLFEVFLKLWEVSINDSRIDQEYLTSLCFFDDYLSNSNIECFNNFYKKFIEYVLSYKTTNEDIIQSMVFGFGVIAQRISRDKWPEVENTILNTITTLLQRPVNDDNGYTYDNAIGALGKVIYYKMEQNDKGLNYAKQFLNLLPVKYDLEESEEIVKLLLKEVILKNAIITNEKVFPEVIKAIHRINEFRKDEEILDEEGLAMLLTVAATYNIN